VLQAGRFSRDARSPTPRTTARALAAARPTRTGHTGTVSTSNVVQPQRIRCWQRRRDTRALPACITVIDDQNRCHGQPERSLPPTCSAAAATALNERSATPPTPPTATRPIAQLLSDRTLQTPPTARLVRRHGRINCRPDSDCSGPQFVHVPGRPAHRTGTRRGYRPVSPHRPALNCNITPTITGGSPLASHPRPCG